MYGSLGQNRGLAHVNTSAPSPSPVSDSYDTLSSLHVVPVPLYTASGLDQRIYYHNGNDGWHISVAVSINADSTSIYRVFEGLPS